MSFFKGQNVIVYGLTQAPELNGQEGVIQDFIADTGRYVILIKSTSKSVSVKSQNLAAVDNAIPPTPPAEPIFLPTAKTTMRIFVKVPEGLKPGNKFDVFLHSHKQQVKCVVPRGAKPGQNIYTNVKIRLELNEQHVNRLMELGFERSEVIHALDHCGAELKPTVNRLLKKKHRMPSEEAGADAGAGASASASSASASASASGSASASASSASASASKNIHSSDAWKTESNLYVLLGVPKDASAGKIRKAYYRLALKYHPDKNKHPEAAAHFKKIGEAYQVLSDPEKRQNYDRYGSESINDQSFVDSAQFFALNFGSAKFEPFIGKMKQSFVASQPAPKDEVDQYAQAFFVELFQEKRVRALIKVLLARLDTFTEDPKTRERFVREAIAERNELEQEPHGKEMTEVIGDMYITEGRKNLGLYHGVSGMFGGIAGRFIQAGQGLRKFGLQMKTVGSFISTTVGAIRAGQSLQAAEALPPDERAALEQSFAEQLRDKVKHLLWQTTRLDMEDTLKAVCPRALGDRNFAVKQKQKARADTLVLWGHILARKGKFKDTEKAKETSVTNADASL